MAEALQREFSLPVLKVRQAADERQTVARCQLMVNAEGRQDVIDQRDWPLQLFGFERSASSGRYEPQLRVPDDAITWIGDFAQEMLGPDAVLWLHLVKPYGALGAVPWEHDLQPACARPLLRLPDVLPPSEVPGSVFRVALCATAPALEGPSLAAQIGPDIANAIAQGVGARLQLHVFGDLLAQDMLDHELAQLGNPVTVHRPGPDFEAEWEHTGGGVNQWLWWMREELKTVSLDAVHFIVHGVTRRDTGAILTPYSPTDPYRDTPSYVGADQLRRFVTSVGASVAGFTRPPDNYSDFGLRHVVDNLGANRAGPVVLHDPETGPVDALSFAYEFLSSVDPAPPPAEASIMLYAQPRQVLDQYQPDLPEFDVSGWPYEKSEAVKSLSERGDTPAWLAVAERYIEERTVELTRLKRSMHDRPSDSQQRYHDGLVEALKTIQGVVDRHAEQAL